MSPKCNKMQEKYGEGFKSAGKSQKSDRKSVKSAGNYEKAGGIAQK